ncbi:MAG: DNA alkylation repair protein [Candidatus Lokiarchaeota archaeon]|nr:DNA alkylation repair protein [Candidatus Lokiarchaeota archaeon]
MLKVEKYLTLLKNSLEKSAPALEEKDKERFYKIINSDNPKFSSYGLKVPEIEKIAREFQKNHQLSFEEAIEVFKELIGSNVHDEKFVGLFLLKRFNKEFTASTIELFHDTYIKYCDTWALCDSTVIRVIGPFLGKKGNEKLARKTVEMWSESENFWIRRASLVILIKLILIKKSFEEKWVFAIIEKMLYSSEDYIQKGVGWLLKTCSNYDPDVVFKYLMNNKATLPRLILRYASEKMSREKRNEI